MFQHFIIVSLASSQNHTTHSNTRKTLTNGERTQIMWSCKPEPTFALYHHTTTRQHDGYTYTYFNTTDTHTLSCDSALFKKKKLWLSRTTRAKNTRVRASSPTQPHVACRGTTLHTAMRCKLIMLPYAHTPCFTHTLIGFTHHHCPLPLGNPMPCSWRQVFWLP